MQHSGLVLCIADVVLASLYMAFSFLIWHPNRTGFREAGIVGGQLGVVMGAILIASHAVESFVTSANSSMQLIRGAGSLLLTLGLLGVSGSATWRRTRSPVMSIVAGLCCASIAAMMLLSFALFLNLTVEGQMESRLDSAFLASGFTDVGAFLCRNALESALQILVQLSVAALVLSTAGCLLNAWLDSRAKVVALVLA